MGRNLDRGDFEYRHEKQQGSDRKNNSKSGKVINETKARLYDNLKK